MEWVYITGDLLLAAASLSKNCKKIEEHNFFMN